MFVYVGAYTEPPLGHAEGLSVFRFDSDTGALRLVQTVRGVANPSFLALDARRRHLYAVNEVDDGGVSAFARDSGAGELTAINQQASEGASPCYISLDPSGRNVLVANYDGGTVSVLPIQEDGGLTAATSVIRHRGSSVDPERQEGPHPHMIAPTPDGQFVLATDLGTDQVMMYRLDAGAGVLAANPDGPAFAPVQPGAGPRHFAFAPDGRTLYVINELDSTLTVFAYDGPRGALHPLQTVSSLPDGFTGENTTAHIAAAPDGRFVYGSNRGHDSIAIWEVSGERGQVTPIGHMPTGGHTPRTFSLDPSGDWLLAANQDSGTIVTFHRDRDTGELAPAGQVTETPSPVAMLFCPD